MALGFRGRLVLGSTLQVVAFAGGAMAVLALLTGRFAAEQVTAAIDAARASFARQMELRLRSWRIETEQCARSPLLLATAAIPGVDEATFADRLAELAAPIVAVLDPSGCVLASRDGWPVGSRPVPADALAASLVQGVRDHVWALPAGRALIAVAPLTQGGELLGALVCGEPIDDRLAQGIGGIAASDVLLWHENRVLGAHWQSSPGRDVDLSALLALSPAAVPAAGLAFGLPIAGEHRTGLATRLHGDGVMVFLSEDLSGITRLRDRARAWLLGCSGLLAVVGVLVAMHTASRLSHPLRALTSASDRMGRGDLSARVEELRQQDELGQLARSFNTMANTVQHLVADVSDKAARAEAANRAKDAFLTSISHELRTPLTGIQSTAELLQQFGEGASPAERDEFLGTILREAERLGRRIGDALDFANLAAGSATWTLGRVDLRSVCTEACRRLDGLQALKRVGFAIAGDGDPVLQGDRERITQAVLHLVRNAWQWSPADGAVEVRVHRDGETFTVEVRDHGPGVPVHERAHVFEAFAQGGDVLVDKPQGMGIGLKIAAEVARMHGGVVDYVEPAGGGACFRLVLRAANRPIDHVAAPVAATTSP